MLRNLVDRKILQSKETLIEIETNNLGKVFNQATYFRKSFSVSTNVLIYDLTTSHMLAII